MGKPTVVSSACWSSARPSPPWETRRRGGSCRRGWKKWSCCLPVPLTESWACPLKPAPQTEGHYVFPSTAWRIFANIYWKLQINVQPTKLLMTETVKSSEGVVRKAHWLLDIVRLLIKNVVYSCSSVYHLAFDQLLDGAHQLRSTGRLWTGRTHRKARRRLGTNGENWMKPTTAWRWMKLSFWKRFIHILSEVQPTNRLTKAVNVKLSSSKCNLSFIFALCLEYIVVF